MEETAHKDQPAIYRWFYFSVILKGVISAAELAVGGLLFFVSLPALVDFCLSVCSFFLPAALMAPIALHADEIVRGLSALPPLFIALYIASRGLIKLALIVAVLMKQLWAYPIALIVLLLFVIYQCYSIFETRSLTLIGITLFDLVVMYSIWREWRMVAARVAADSRLAD
jgi:uncharacterized membrane protein